MAERWREPFASSPEIRSRMQALPREDTQPEMLVRRALHAAGFRYRVHVRPIPELSRRADIVFRRERVAIFVDGCFWHGCPDHGRRVHRTNGWYWPDKIERNKERDVDTDQHLAKAGWLVERVWEHEDSGQAAARIVSILRSRRSTLLR